MRLQIHIIKLLSISLLLVSLGSTQVSAGYTLPFSDVSEDNLSRTAISYLQQQEIIQGYSDGTFKPTASISRAEFLKILLEHTSPVSNDQLSFSDVQTTDWFYNAVQQGVARGIVQGFGDNTFRPHNPITKAEAMKMISTLLQLETCTGDEKRFEDVQSNDWYVTYISIFSSCNLDPYISPTRAEPQVEITRQQASELLFRSLVTAKSGNIFSHSDYTTNEGYILLPSSVTQEAISDYMRSLSSVEKERIEMLRERKKAVVSIIAADSEEGISNYLDTLASTDKVSQPKLAYSVTHGTGFFINANGTIVTNKHVVSKSTSSYKVILGDGTLYDIQKITRDPLLDLAFIDIKNIDSARFSFLSLESGTTPLIGQDSYMIGNSLGMYPGSVGRGVITGVHRIVNALNSDNSNIRLFDMIQTDAGISQGDSGGPLLDSKGRLLGVSSALDQEGVSIGFAIPVRYILASKKSFDTYGDIMKPYIGIRYVHLTPKYGKDRLPSDATSGALISSDTSEQAVLDGAPASKSGLKEGDIILSVNGESISKSVYLSDLLALYRSGETVYLEILRDTKKITVEVTLDVRQ